MNYTTHDIERAADRLFAAYRSPEEFTAAFRAVAADLFPTVSIRVLFHARKENRMPETGENVLESFDLPGNAGFWRITCTEPTSDESAYVAFRLFVRYITSVLAHRNEEAISNRLSVLLNNEIDNHHATHAALQRERSARAGFEKKLADYSRKITEAIVETQEMERRRFARDLHDGIGNTLAMVKLLVSSLSPDSSNDAEDTEILQRILLLLDTAVAESRQLSRSLTSEMLIEHGLIPTLKEMISRINASGSLHADLQIFGITHPLPKHIEQNLFRIIQELVNNIIKHARASEFTVQCIQHEDSIIVMVEDDGSGLGESKEAASLKGMGFGNIRTRLDVLDGSMAVDSSPGRGTIITLEIPFPGRGPQVRNEDQAK